MAKVKLIANVAVCPPGYTSAIYPGQEMEVEEELAAQYIAEFIGFKNEPGARPTKNVGAMVPIEGIDE